MGQLVRHTEWQVDLLDCGALHAGASLWNDTRVQAGGREFFPGAGCPRPRRYNEQEPPRVTAPASDGRAVAVATARLAGMSKPNMFNRARKYRLPLGHKIRCLAFQNRLNGQPASIKMHSFQDDVLRFLAMFVPALQRLAASAKGSTLAAAASKSVCDNRPTTRSASSWTIMARVLPSANLPI